MQLPIKFAAFFRAELALSRCICRIIFIAIFIVKCAPASARVPAVCGWGTLFAGGQSHVRDRSNCWLARQ
jgi:hypothetical protein